MVQYSYDHSVHFSGAVAARTVTSMVEEGVIMMELQFKNGTVVLLCSCVVQLSCVSYSVNVWQRGMVTLQLVFVWYSAIQLCRCAIATPVCTIATPTLQYRCVILAVTHDTANSALLLCSCKLV